MFSLNGHPLDDAARGWLVLEDGTNPLASLDVELSALIVGGRDGVRSVPGSRLHAPVIPLEIETPDGDALEALFALLRSSTLTLTDSDRPGKILPVELLTAAPVETGGVVEVSCAFRVPGVFWRGETIVTTDPAALGSASVAVAAFPGASAPIRDAIIRVAGGITNVKVEDSRGSFFRYPTVLPAGSYLRFDSATGRAWATPTNTWTGGTEVTGLIESGAGDYPLELWPAFTNPSTRAVALTVTSSARTGSPTIEIRGRSAHAR